MIRQWRTSLVGAMLLATIGCGGEFGDTNSEDGQAPRVIGAEPPLAMPGSNVTIYGRHFLDWDYPIVRIGGFECPVLSALDNKIIVHLPPDVAPGHVTVDNGIGNSVGTNDFTVGIPTTVVEQEPNDEAHGLNATLENGNRSVSGTLSSNSDVDHFRIQTMIQAHWYRVHVTPSNIPSILVNNQPQNLDGNGDVLVKCASDESSDLATWLVVGITGFTGPYSMTVSLVP